MKTESMPQLNHTLHLTDRQRWRYETDEFYGVCEIAHDSMVVKIVFEGVSNKFYDVLAIDGYITWCLKKPISVERLAEQLSSLFPDLDVTVSGRAKTHGWITSSVTKRYPAS